MMPSQRELYPGEEYFALRPGITGPWQTSDRHETSFSDRARFDHRYYHELSFATDLKIMTRTVSVVVSGTGC
jgi:lipopolysaccharide/colanic/teichoic acid biosynthesis glycosyltransferase